MLHHKSMQYMLKIANDPFSNKHYINMAISSTFQFNVHGEFNQHCQYFLSIQTTAVPAVTVYRGPGLMSRLTHVYSS